MFKLLFFILVTMALPKQSPAGNMLSGARPAGMANATAAVYGFWALTHNQAGIARIDNPSLSLYAENRYMIPGLSQGAAGYIHPSGAGALGVALTWFGNDLFNEGKAGITYARLFGEKFSAGVKLNYLFMSVGDGYGSTGTVVAEAGIICEILPGLHVGAHIFNPARSKITSYSYLDQDERYPAIIRTGLAYSLSESLLISVEAQKDIRHQARAKMGLEYGLGEQLMLRAGVATNPMENSFGFGLRKGDWQLDIASSYHYVLGYSPQAGVLYSW